MGPKSYDETKATNPADETLDEQYGSQAWHLRRLGLPDLVLDVHVDRKIDQWDDADDGREW